MSERPPPPAPPREPALSLVKVAQTAFTVTFHLEEMVHCEIGADLQVELGASALVPGQVIAVLEVRHDGNLDVDQVASPWSFRDLGALTEFGALLYQARELAEETLGPNWTGPRKIQKIQLS